MKIVVRGTNWIGDAVMTIPALRELRRVFPDAHITLHTRAWAEGIFRDADFIDELLPFERGESNISDVFDQARVLRKAGFDAAVLFPNSFASALTARFAGIADRFGYSKEGRGLFLSHPVRIPEWKNKRHEVFYYLNLVGEVEKFYLGTETVREHDPVLELGVSEARKAHARQILTESGIDVSRRIIGLGVGSANSRAKRWPAKYYAELNDRLQAGFDVQVVLFGSNEESTVAAEVFERTDFKPVNLAGRTKLDEAVAVLSVIDVLISNDMGPAHIAPAVGTKTIVIFGPTNPETTRPYSENAMVLRKGVECSPCMLRDCPIDHRCMTWITVDDVFGAAADFLNEKRSIQTPGGIS